MGDDKEKDDVEEVLGLAEKAEEDSEPSGDLVKPEPAIDSGDELETEQIKKPSSGISGTNLKAPLKTEEESEQDDDDDDDDPQEKSNRNLFLLGGIGLTIIVLLTGGFFLFSTRDIQKEKKAPVAVAPIPMPTEVPERALVKSDWQMEVLNGSGIAGLAKKVAEKIKGLDYQVVKTGNADKDDYQTTQIWVKKDLLDKADLIIADLKDVVKIASVAGELTEGTASARIILGKDRI